MTTARQPATAARRFSSFTGGVHARLPRPLRRVIDPTFIGYAIINSSAFALDLGLLSIFHGNARIPYPYAVTLGYALAASASFVVNRWLNFQEYGDLGKQTSKYVVVMVSNYLIWILAFSSLLEWLGVQYQVSRIVAALVEGLYIYVLMRLWVFPRRRDHAHD